jgi:hypothetical protein
MDGTVKTYNDEEYRVSIEYHGGWVAVKELDCNKVVITKFYYPREKISQIVIV